MLLCGGSKPENDKLCWMRRVVEKSSVHTERLKLVRETESSTGDIPPGGSVTNWSIPSRLLFRTKDRLPLLQPTGY